MKKKRIEQLSSKIDMIANGKRKKMAKEGNFSGIHFFKYKIVKFIQHFI